MTQNTLTHCYKWQLWLWSYGSWIYNYPCNQCLVPQMMGVRILIRARCTTVCDKVCQWLATGLWLSLGPPVSSTNKTDCHDISEILSNTIKQTNKQTKHCYHLTHVCHNETNYIDTFLSSYSCVSQWHKVLWGIAIILYMCVTMTQSTLAHCYHLIHECHNDAKYFGTLLSSYTCVSQWHNVHWHIVIILYMCVTMTPRTLTHCYNLIPVCHNDTK
jgi:hypothetical protein